MFVGLNDVAMHRTISTEVRKHQAPPVEKIIKTHLYRMTYHRGLLFIVLVMEVLHELGAKRK